MFVNFSSLYHNTWFDYKNELCLSRILCTNDGGEKVFFFLYLSIFQLLLFLPVSSVIPLQYPLQLPLGVAERLVSWAEEVLPRLLHLLQLM